MQISDLATLNAVLNGSAACLLLLGYRFIKRREIDAHRKCMIAAFAVSIAFLFSYVIYHAKVGSVPFQGTGLIRPIYFTLLITHVVLAAAVPVLASITLLLGLRRRDERHRLWARWTFPIWLYVSVTGVIIYLMLYHFEAVAG